MTEDDRRARQDDLAFCAMVGADVTHDVRNVLAIIGEYAGLLDDLLGLAERGKPLDGAKLRDLSAKITRQVRKGTETMERFSRFAHAADEPTTSFDLSALVENVVALAQRRVALAGCRLEAELPDRPVPMRGNPFAVQRAVFSCIQRIVESLAQGESVRVKLVAQGPAAVLHVSGAGGELAGGVPQGLSAIVGQWKGTVETTWAEGIVSLVLSIPTQ
jgi:nitrogen fixation/metabolism regulation signal transduction histidine kinase